MSRKESVFIDTHRYYTDKDSKNTSKTFESIKGLYSRNNTPHSFKWLAVVITSNLETKNLFDIQLEKKFSNHKNY